MHPGDTAITEALTALANACNEAQVRHLLIGGMAAVARGVPRHTNDIDLTVEGAIDQRAFLATLSRHGITGRIDDVLGFAKNSLMLLLRHTPTGTPIDISLGWLPFEHDAISRGEPLTFGSATLPVATVEDLIIFKAVAWRERDRSDIERLFALHLRSLDLDRIRRFVTAFSELLDDADRVSQLDAVLSRVEQALSG